MADQFNILDQSDRVPKGKLLRATGVLGESIPRSTRMDNVTPLSTGRQSFQLAWLEGGVLVSNITFVSWTTAGGTLANQWFTLYDLSRNKLAVTADDGATAWAAFTAKTLAVATPYLIPASGFYYLGINVTATTVPSLGGAAVSNLASSAPILCGHDATNTGLTNPASAPATAAALTGTTNVLYCHVS